MQYIKPQATNTGDTHAHRLLVLLLLTGCPFNNPTRSQRAAAAAFAAAAPVECYPATPGMQQSHLHCVHPRHAAAPCG
jgi:hypothetical protein